MGIRIPGRRGTYGGDVTLVEDPSIAQQTRAPDDVPQFADVAGPVGLLQPALRGRRDPRDGARIHFKPLWEDDLLRVVDGLLAASPARVP